jgi:5-formaminoimidazole-4-carboxamide-1-beta-D-ribofuranosyl 5'-monophosphate synthetase
MKTIDFIPYIKQSGELIPPRSFLASFGIRPNGFPINFFLARALIRLQTNLRRRISLLEDADYSLLFL